MLTTQDLWMIGGIVVVAFCAVVGICWFGLWIAEHVKWVK
jgi:hypothetical protein